MAKHRTKTDTSDRGRVSARRKAEAVLRLLRGEDLDALSRGLGVTAATPPSRREAFLDGGTAAMKGRPADDRGEPISRLRAKVGRLATDHELLGQECRHLEAGRPPAPGRRSGWPAAPPPAPASGTGSSGSAASSAWPARPPTTSRPVRQFRADCGHLGGVYLIHDGGPIHVAAATNAYLTSLGSWWRHRRTPANASWLNQSELLNNAFGGRYLKRGSWSDRGAFLEHVRASGLE